MYITYIPPACPRQFIWIVHNICKWSLEKIKNKECCVGKILCLKTVIKDMYLNCEGEELVMLQVTHRAASGGKSSWNLVYSLSGVHTILHKWKRNSWNTEKITFRETIKLRMTSRLEAPKNEQSIKTSLVLQLGFLPGSLERERKKNKQLRTTPWERL